MQQDLKIEIQDLLGGRDDLPLDTFYKQTIHDLKTLKTNYLIKHTLTNIHTLERYISLPKDFQILKSIHIVEPDGDSHKIIEQIFDYEIQNDKLFIPAGIKEALIKLTYYKKIQDNQTDTENLYLLLLNGILTKAYHFINNTEQAMQTEQKYYEEKRRLEKDFNYFKRLHGV